MSDNNSSAFKHILVFGIVFELVVPFDRQCCQDFGCFIEFVFR